MFKFCAHDKLQPDPFLGSIVLPGADGPNPCLVSSQMTCQFLVTAEFLDSRQAVMEQQDVV
jgi:hypothetical protein